MTRHITRMEIGDAEHYTEAERAAIIASYPAHEREARIKGIPSLGSGRVFPVADEKVIIDPIAIAKDWAQINGLDFGYDHPFGAAHLAWDRDADVIYVTKTYREREATPIIHAAAVKPWGDWIPCAWPHDGLPRPRRLDGSLMAYTDSADAKPAKPKKERSKTDDAEICKLALKRHQRWVERERENTEAAYDDLKFKAGEQWTKEAQGRPR
jgi:hypothetical protein